MGYLHPHTTLTLLEGFEQDAADAAAPAAITATAATGAVVTVSSSAALSSGSTVRSSSRGVSPTQNMTQFGGSSRKSEVLGVTSVTPVTRVAPDAAMLRHSWATGGTGSTWRQQQQQQQQMAAAAAAVASGDAQPGTTGSSSDTSTGKSYNPQQQDSQQQHVGQEQLTTTTTSSSSSSSDKAPPVYAGTAAAGSDWAATAAKAAQLRSVIEWGLEAYGVNAAGSEPSNEVSVVIWPGGRGTKSDTERP